MLDPQTLTPFLGNRTGGLCGPAIKPVALRMVWEVAGALEVPIIGMGGVVERPRRARVHRLRGDRGGVGAANFTGPTRRGASSPSCAPSLPRRGLADLAAVRGRALGSQR